MYANILTWISLGVLTVIGIFFALVLLAAYFEKQKLVALEPAGPDAPAERIGTAGGYVNAADHQDFQSIGYLVDLGGSKRGYVSLLLSHDRLVLVTIVHGMAARIKLSSKLSDGRWLITNQKP